MKTSMPLLVPVQMVPPTPSPLPPPTAADSAATEDTRAPGWRHCYPFVIAPELWRKMGADGFAPDAQAAIILANQLRGPGAAA